MYKLLAYFLYINLLCFCLPTVNHIQFSYQQSNNEEQIGNIDSGLDSHCVQ